MYNFFCGFDFFTMESQCSIDQFQVDLKACANSFIKNASSSPHSLNKLTFGQGRLSELMAQDNKIRTNFISIQTMFLPHMVVI